MEQKRGEGKEKFKKGSGKPESRGEYLKKGGAGTSLRTMYYWLRSDIAMIPEIHLSENVWMIVERNIQPVWFVGKEWSTNFVSNIKQT